jgi:hypothetical protein
MLAFTNIILCNSNGLAVNELIKELTFDEGVAIRYPPPDINVFLNVAGYPKSMAQQVLVSFDRRWMDG